MPATIVVLRFGIGLILIVTIVFLRGNWRWIKLKDLPMLALLGLLGVTFHQWLQASGLKTAEATVGSWIVATVPVFVAILGRFLLKEALGRKRAVGIAVAFVGALIVVGKGNPIELITGQTGALGDFLFLLSSINWAVFTVLSRRVLRAGVQIDNGEGSRQFDKPYDPLASIMVVLGFGWVFSLIWFVFGGSIQDIYNLRGDTLWVILFLGIACSGLAYIFWYQALGVVDATRAGAFLYFEPIVTALVAWPMLGEDMSVGSIVGAMGILIGVWIVNRS
jgi:drug/metabolite transporter (DMT)-like permease